MLSIRVGFTPSVVIEYLQHATSAARTVLNSDGDADKIGRYLEWAANQQRTLGSSISTADVDRLITTRTYWALVSSGGVTAIALLNHELQQRVTDLESEEVELRIEAGRWAQIGWTTAAVLDTNTVMTHHASFRDVAWHELVGERDMRTVRVIIPQIVIDELDVLKRATGNMKIGGKDYPRRTLARQALRTISRMFSTFDTVISINQSTAPPYALPVTFELLADAPGHVRLANADAEIRDRALSLSAHTNRVLLVTYDLGNQLAAGLSGLEALRLVDEEDKALPADFPIAPPLAEPDASGKG